MRESPTRRRVLRSAAVAGLAAAAGCVSAGSSADAADSPTESPSATATATPAPTTTAAATDEVTEATELSEPESLDAWLAEANGYDGEIHRSTGPRTDVWVGHPTDDGLAFDPPAIEVPPMTRVRWDWSDHGGQRNVVALDGTFDSGRTNAQPGTSYEWIFEETGTYPYVSEPHVGEGMRGAVVVKQPPTTGYDEVDQWVVDSDNFDGSVADRTGTDRTTVTVGAPGNGGRFAFDPPVLKVSPETTVAWEWSGEGPYNVAFPDRGLKSGPPQTEAGVHFEHAFEEGGTYLYACLPHEGLGMKGAVVVE